VQRPPLSAADDLVFVHVAKFLAFLAAYMPLEEAMLLLYATRDNLLPLLDDDNMRPRVRCAVLDVLVALCSREPASPDGGVTPPTATSTAAAPESRATWPMTRLLAAAAGPTVASHGSTTPSGTPAARDARSVAAYIASRACDASIAGEAIAVALDADVLPTCLRIIRTVPAELYLQTQVRAGQQLDDVRVHALALVESVVTWRGRSTASAQYHVHISAQLETLVRTLVATASSFRSPDAAARHRSLCLAVRVSVHWRRRLLL
jgi:hypothetical protein